MSKDSYVHVLLDKDPGGPAGQEICDKCKLSLPEHLEAWEEFLNGELLYGEPPQAEGYYPVFIRSKKRNDDPTPFDGSLVYDVLHARPALRKKNVFVWSDPRLGAKVVGRWSLPYPPIWVEYTPFFSKKRK